MNEKTKIKLLIFIVLGLGVALIGVLALMINENNQCIKDPFTYIGKKMHEAEEKYDAYFDCSCQSLTPKHLSFTFDEKGVKIKKFGLD